MRAVLAPHGGTRGKVVRYVRHHQSTIRRRAIGPLVSSTEAERRSAKPGPNKEALFSVVTQFTKFRFVVALPQRRVFLE